MKKRNGLKLHLDRETLRKLEIMDSPELAGIVAGGCGPTCRGGETFLCSDSICVNASS